MLRRTPAIVALLLSPFAVSIASCAEPSTNVIDPLDREALSASANADLSRHGNADARAGDELAPPGLPSATADGADPLGTPGKAAHSTVYARTSLYRSSKHWIDSVAKPPPATAVVRRAGDEVSPVYEYFSGALKDHLYTLKKEELEAEHTGGPVLRADSWAYTGISFFVSKEKQPGQVPLLVYFSVTRGDHVLTTDINKYGADGDRRYRPRGTLGYVWADRPAAASDAVLVHAYYDEKRGDHVYSTDSRLDMNAHNPLSVSYRYVGHAFYTRAGPFETVSSGPAAHKPKRITTDDPIPIPDPDMPLKHSPTFNWTSALDAAAKLPARSLFRYFSTFDEDSLITADYNLLRAGAGGWKFSKEIGEGFPGDVVDTVPLFRYFNQHTRSHFYTTDGLEVGAEHGWVYLGAETFVYPKKPESSKVDTIALNRHFNPLTSSYAWTTEGEDVARIESLGYINEGTVCYILKLGQGAALEAARIAKLNATGNLPAATTPTPTPEPERATIGGGQFLDATPTPVPTREPDVPDNARVLARSRPSHITAAGGFQAATPAPTAAAATPASGAASPTTSSSSSSSSSPSTTTPTSPTSSTTSSSSSSSSSAPAPKAPAAKTAVLPAAPAPAPKPIESEDVPNVANTADAKDNGDKGAAAVAAGDLPPVPPSASIPGEIPSMGSSNDGAPPPPPPTLAAVRSKVKDQRKKVATAAASAKKAPVESLEEKAMEALKDIGA